MMNLRRTLSMAMTAACFLALTGCAFKQHMQRGESRMADGQYREAMIAFQAAVDDPYQYGETEARARLVEAREAWTGQLREALQTQAAAGRHGYALLLAATLADLTADEVYRREAAEHAAALRNGRPWNVALRARQALGEPVISEIERALANDMVLRVLRPDPLVQVQGPAFEILATQPLIRRAEHETIKTARFVTGKTTAPNPKHATLAADADRARQRITQATLAVNNANNEVLRSDIAAALDVDRANEHRFYSIQQLEQARARVRNEQAALRRVEEELGRTPPTVEQPIYDTMTYPARVWEVEATGALRLTDQSEGRNELIFDEPVRASFRGEIYQAQPKAEIKASAEPPPADDAITTEVARLAALRVANFLRERREESLTRAAEASLNAASGQPLDAAGIDELVADWWQAGPDKPALDAKVNMMIDDNLSISEAARLLAPYRTTPINPTP